MIKIITEKECSAKKPERTIHFQFRKHEQATVVKSKENLAFLVATDEFGNKLFPIKVDGETNEFVVRQATVANLGFRLVVTQQ